MTKQSKNGQMDNSPASPKIRSCKIWLWLARVNAKHPWASFVAACLLTLVVCCIIGLCHQKNGESNPFGKAFVDMVSPVTMRNVAYNSHTKMVEDNNSTPIIIKTIPADERCLPGLFFLYMFGAIVLSGVVIASITNTLRAWADRFKQGNARIGRFSGHIVIIGHNNMVSSIIKQIIDDNDNLNNKRNLKRMILVGVESDVPGMWYQIRNHSGLTKEQRLNFAVVQVDSSSTDHLKKRLQVRRAKEVYIIGGHDDTENIKIFDTIQELCGDGKPSQGNVWKPECYVHLQHQSSIVLLKKHFKPLDHFHAFNIHEELAKTMLMKNEFETRNNESISNNPQKYIHLVIIGMTEMGEALAREAALRCHYSNYATDEVRTRITFIDSQAKEQMAHFMGRYRQLFELCNYSFRKAGGVRGLPILEKDFLDIEFDFIQADIAEKSMQKEINDWANDKSQVLTIAVCDNMPERSMETGFLLPEAVYENNIPVWIYQQSNGNIKKLMNHPHFKNITTFGMSDVKLDFRSEKRIKYNADKIEHNRRNVEMLLMGFRPTTNDEHKLIKEKAKTKNEFRGKFIDDDIRPYNELDEEGKNRYH